MLHSRRSRTEAVDPKAAVGAPQSRRPLREVIDEPAEPMLKFAVRFCLVVLRLTKQQWHHQEKIPRTGGVIFVTNHISNADPLAYGHYITYAGRWPRFLAKDAIFRVPVLGFVASRAGQIRVHRHTGNAHAAAAAAVDAVRAGKAVTIYPEGTITGDPLGWPMNPKTGAARVALESGCPVVPVANWGAQEILPGKKLTWPRLLPRKTIRVTAGDPVELDDLRAREHTSEVIAEAGERIISALTTLVGELRGEQPPTTRWDLKTGSRVPPLFVAGQASQPAAEAEPSQRPRSSDTAASDTESSDTPASDTPASAAGANTEES